MANELVFVSHSVAGKEAKAVELETPFASCAFEVDVSQSYRENRSRADAAFEKCLLQKALGITRGNVSAAARMLNMDRKHLRELARRNGVLICGRGENWVEYEEQP